MAPAPRFPGDAPGPADPGRIGSDPRRIRWLAGDAELRAALETAWRDPRGAGAERTVLRDRPERRRLLRFRWRDGPDLFVKQFYMSGRRHRLRKRLVRMLRLEAARREWRALSRLARAGVPVPAPRALGVLPGGDRILAMDHLPGRAPAEALRDAARSAAAGPTGLHDPARLAEELGRLLAALHARGVVHRDLHQGNVLLARSGPVLLDLQLARRGRSLRARLRDLGDLESSLERELSRACRVRLRAAALGLARPFDAAARELLRAAGEAASHRACAHAASRRRRAGRAGRRFAAVRHRRARGLRVRELGADLLGQALDAHRAGRGELLRRDARAHVRALRVGDRHVVVKQLEPGGFSERVGQRLRGSAARRAWLAGVGLEAHGIAAARPLAYLERRRLGLAAGCWLVLEDLRPARRLSDLPAGERAGLAAELGRLLQRLAERRILHRGLRADRVWWRPGPGAGAGLRLSGLEHVRFDAPLSAAEREGMRARIAAALPEGGLSPAWRR